MSDFEKEGFFSATLGDFSQQCRKYYSEWFALCEAINRFSLGIRSKAAYHPDNHQEVLTAALFLRMLSIFEATVILTERCMFTEARILLRALMEALFALAAVAVNKQVAEEYYQNHLKTKLKALQNLKRYAADTMLHGVDLNKRMEELRAQIKLNKVRDINTQYLADTAGLGEFYNTAYTVLSWAVHSNVLDIAHTHMAGQSEDNVESVHLSFQIENEDTETLFMSMLECMVIALRSVDHLFKAGAENEIADYDRRYKNLFVSRRKEIHG